MATLAVAAHAAAAGVVVPRTAARSRVGSTSINLPAFPTRAGHLVLGGKAYVVPISFSVTSPASVNRAISACTVLLEPAPTPNG